MSFLDNLDEEGKQIYRDYIIHCNKWVNYIMPKANKKMNDYFDTTQKKFYKYEYLTFEYNYTYIDINCSNNKCTPALIAKYKKLCLLFHPDKFNNSYNTLFFVLINSFYKENNEFMINIIDTIAQYVLELDNLENIINNLDKILTSKNNITNVLKHITDANELFAILNSTDILAYNTDAGADNVQNMTEQDADINKFLSSTVYSFYKGNKTTVDYINDNYITEEQVIEIIKNCTKLDKKIIDFYKEKYEHSNMNIRIAVYEWLNNELKKENEILRERLEKKL